MKNPLTIDGSKKVVAGVGSALVDILLQESEPFVRGAGAQIGGMKLVDRSFIPGLLKKSGRRPAIVPGGSACNTILGIGRLGGAARFIGKRGSDAWGDLFEAGLRRHNVEPVLFTSPSPTGHVLSIITPDAQRSMLTFLGAAAETDPAELTPSLFADASIVHLEGYLLFNRELMQAAVRAAKSAGALLSLDLASYTVVENSREFLRSLVRSDIDILIANEDESRVYTGHADERKAVLALSEYVSCAAVKMGGRGSLIAHAGSITTVPALNDGTPVVDTTGAGDLWAAGFLYGLTQGFSMEKCGSIAAACGYEVCKVIGATIPEEGWGRIRRFL